MRLRFLLAIGLATACAMHTAGSRMSARVLGGQPGSPTQATPVPGAHLLLTCPDGMRADLGRTDSDGVINISPSSAPALDCRFTVARAGYHPDTFSVGDACIERAANVCVSMRVTRVLEPSGSAGD